MLLDEYFLKFCRIVVPSYLFGGQRVQGDFFYFDDEDITDGEQNRCYTIQMKHQLDATLCRSSHLLIRAFRP